eukprot:128057-Rhodomonas_salina.1
MRYLISAIRLRACVLSSHALACYPPTCVRATTLRACYAMSGTDRNAAKYSTRSPVLRDVPD